MASSGSRVTFGSGTTPGGRTPSAAAPFSREEPSGGMAPFDGRTTTSAEGTHPLREPPGSRTTCFIPGRRKNRQATKRKSRMAQKPCGLKDIRILPNHSGCNTEVPLNIGKDAIPKRARLLNIPCTEGKAKTFCSSVGFMNSNVAPPHTAIIPQVVVEVVVVDTKRDFSLL